MYRTLKFKLQVLYPETLDFLVAKYHEIYSGVAINKQDDYYHWKGLNPNIPASFIQGAIHYAQGVRKSMKSNHSRSRNIRKSFIRLRAGFKVENGELQLRYISWGRGRKAMWLSYKLVGRLEELKRYERVKAIEIHKKGSEYYAYLIVETPSVRLYEPETILGIDRGLKNIAAATLTNMEGIPIHNPWYFGGGDILHRHRQYRQQRRTYGNAKRVDKIKSTKGRESNFVRDINHKISRQIVDIAHENKSLIVLEDLRGINKSKANWGKLMNYQKSSWSYCQLKGMIEYKAEERGVKVIYVDPRNTSKTCSKCKQIGNRDGLWFICTHCGFQFNADANASKNIADRGREILLSHRAQSKGIAEVPTGK